VALVGHCLQVLQVGPRHAAAGAPAAVDRGVVPVCVVGEVGMGANAGGVRVVVVAGQASDVERQVVGRGQSSGGVGGRAPQVAGGARDGRDVGDGVGGGVEGGVGGGGVGAVLSKSKVEFIVALPTAVVVPLVGFASTARVGGGANEGGAAAALRALEQSGEERRLVLRRRPPPPLTCHIL